MFFIFLSIILGLLFAASAYFLIKFARIILIFEGDLEEGTEVLRKSEKTLEEHLNMQLYFDSPELQKKVIDSLEGIKVAKLAIAHLVDRFTERSKKKYVEIVEIEPRNYTRESEENDGE